MKYTLILLTALLLTPLFEGTDQPTKISIQM